MSKQVLAEAASDILIAYLRAVRVAAKDMPALVGNVCGALNRASATAVKVARPAQRRARPTPAIPIQELMPDDRLVCLLCGRKFQTLRRHLGEKHGLSPDQYRATYELPENHPMDAPSYVEVRARLARARGLGKRIAWQERPPADPDRRKRKRREAAMKPVQAKRSLSEE
jgi:predicted transcriptional regulator